MVAPALRRHVRRAAGRRHWRVGRWAVFGVDGSRVECPRTKANEAAFGSAGRRKTGPQQFLTTLFHVGTGLVWDFRRGDARASERAHLLAMLPALPRRRCLLLADAGFTGYDLLAALRGTGRSFVIRVGRNVRLLRKLGWVADEHDGVVYLWPAKARDRRDPPLVLRLVTLTDGRNRRTHLLTDVLDRAALPDAAVGALYRRRWGVELLYRSLKQTMGRRRLLCGSPAAATAELDWAVVGLWLLGLISVGRLAAAGQAPDRWGVAASLRAVRRAIGVVAAAARCRPCRRRTPSLGDELARATKDAYARRGPRRARDWPHKKRDRPPGDPRARNASESEVALAAELRSKGAAA